MGLRHPLAGPENLPELLQGEGLRGEAPHGPPLGHGLFHGNGTVLADLREGDGVGAVHGVLGPAGEGSQEGSAEDEDEGRRPEGREGHRPDGRKGRRVVGHGGLHWIRAGTVPGTPDASGPRPPPFPGSM